MVWVQIISTVPGWSNDWAVGQEVYVLITVANNLIAAGLAVLVNQNRGDTVPDLDENVRAVVLG